MTLLYAIASAHIDDSYIIVSNLGLKLILQYLKHLPCIIRNPPASVPCSNSGNMVSKL